MTKIPKDVFASSIQASNEKAFKPSKDTNNLNKGEVTIYTATDLEVARAEVRREMYDEILSMSWDVGGFAYQITKEDLNDIAEGTKEQK